MVGPVAPPLPLVVDELDDVDPMPLDEGVLVASPAPPDPLLEASAPPLASSPSDPSPLEAHACVSIIATAAVAMRSG
jgi:hypothetical protein